MTVPLSAVTWDHPRAHAPLERTAAVFAERTGIEIRWEARSLYDFGMQPLSALAREHDLLVIDRPHVGEAAGAGDLRALDDLVAADDLARLAEESVGAMRMVHAVLAGQATDEAALKALDEAWQRNLP